MAFKKQYLNPKEGSRLTGSPVAYTDFQGLRAYAHSLVTREDTDYHSKIDRMDIKQLRQWFIDEGFEFKPLDQTRWQPDGVGGENINQQ